jgi:hypothetical protein
MLNYYDVVLKVDTIKLAVMHELKCSFRVIMSTGIS